jgi:hypothetical protein
MKVHSRTLECSTGRTITEIFEFKYEPDKETIDEFLTYVRFRFPNQDIEIFHGGARVKITKKVDNPVKKRDNNAGWGEEDNVYEYGTSKSRRRKD